MHNSVSTGSLRTVAASFAPAIPILRISFFLLAVLGLDFQAGEARTVRVSVPAASISVTAFFVARDRGFYKQEGLDVQLIQMPGGIAIQALVAGGLDFSTVVA